MMRKLSLGSPASASTEAKVSWLVDGVRQIAQASHDTDALSIADSFTVTSRIPENPRSHLFVAKYPAKQSGRRDALRQRPGAERIHRASGR
jgi:hypothetical protein